MTVFCDSFALSAWINARDSHHAVVDRWFSANVAKIVVTEWVLVEVADALSQPVFRSSAIRMIERIRQDPQFDVVTYDSKIERAGFDLYAARPDKSWSLTDCFSFIVMSTRGIDEALSADHHFEQAGFRAIFKN